MQPKTVENKNTSSVRPFLKWAGGKGQLLNIFENQYPKELKDGKIKDYYEPFVGGGAVFFDLVNKYNIENAKLFDINEELVLTYRVIQKEIHSLFEFLDRFSKQYKRLDLPEQKKYFYDFRLNFNQQRFNIDYHKYSENWIPRAAQIIFLNKTCYNGLFRMNSKGEFNSPAGSYKNPNICDIENLTKVHDALQRAEIRLASFDDILNTFNGNGFVYFDPPYRPISETSSFTSYSKYGFDDKKQKELARTFTTLHEKGALLMLSNSDPKNNNPDDNFFDDLYNGFNIQRVPAKRMVNSNAKKRGTINEILITNY
jgi:DNA adenine methylase